MDGSPGALGVERAGVSSLGTKIGSLKKCLGSLELERAGIKLHFRHPGMAAWQFLEFCPGTWLRTQHPYSNVGATAAESAAGIL